MSKKDFAVVIVNYNTAHLTIQTLESFYRNHRGENFKVVVVDNNSSDPEKEVLEDYFSNHKFGNLQVWWSEENLGFGGGNNLGARVATEKSAGENGGDESKYLLFLNADTILTENILGPLRMAFEAESDAQILSPLLRLENGEVQEYLAGDFATLGGLVLGRNKDMRKKLGAKSPALLEVDWVSGCALAIQRERFARLGGFDTDYFMYFEDQDLCKRSANLGGKTALLTTASLIHLGGKSIAKTNTRKDFYFASQDIFWKKHYSSISCLFLKILRVPYRWFNKD